MAIASVLVGLVAVPLFLFPAPAAAAIVLGVVGHRHARDLSGEIMGVIGATVGIVVMVLFVVLVALNLDDVTRTMPLTGAALGTCFKETYPEDLMVRKDCGERHGSELFAIVQHRGADRRRVPHRQVGPVRGQLPGARALPAALRRVRRPAGAGVDRRDVHRRLSR